jgi:immune inhibitor A
MTRKHFWLVCLTGFAFISIYFTDLNAQMPPHPLLKEKILRGEIQAPFFWGKSEEMQQRGIDAPWAEFSGPDKVGRVWGPSTAPTGNYRALVVLVKFTDKNNTVAGTFFDNLVFGTGSSTLYDYYNKVSYNALDIVTVNLPSAIGWQTAPQTYSYYRGTDQGMGTYPRNSQKLCEDIVKLIDPIVNFANYDNNGDGEVDALFLVHAGSGAEYTGDINDIWSHAWHTYNVPVLDGVGIHRYSIEPEYWVTANDMTCGVYAHEMGHAAFGLPDLYDTDNSSEGIGKWSIMASGSWCGTSPGGNFPSFPDAWTHIQMGFLTPVNVTSNQYNQSINAITSSAQAFRLWTNGSSGDQFFLVQNRQKSGYDAYLPGSGICIWHVDQTKTNNQQEWYPDLSMSNHYKVALEQADGNWDLEHNRNRGDAGDPYPGSSNNQSFNQSSTPNSHSYPSDTNTWVQVRNISNSATTMTADLIVTQEVQSVIVTSPNGGEIWQVGSVHDIIWASLGTSGLVKIEYSTNNGSNWSDVIASTPDDGTHPWVVPNTPSITCLIRVTDADDSPSDVSNAVFTIFTAGYQGDVNDDAAFNSSDALIILSCDVGMNTAQFCPMNCGDVSADGLINSTDALIILSYDVGMSVPFPVGQSGCNSIVDPCDGCGP